MKLGMFPGAISRREIALRCPLSRFATGALFAVSFITGLPAGIAALNDPPLIATITVGVNPNGLAVTPNGDAVYVANSGSNTVSVIRAATNSVIATIPVGDTPMFVAITPDGATAFVTNNKDNTVSVISTANNTVVDTLIVGQAPWGLAVKPDGSKLWVCNRGTGTNDGTVSVIDIATRKTVRTISIPVGQSPLYVLFSPDGLRAHVLNQGDLAPTGTHVQGYLTELDATKGRIDGERTFTQDNTAPLGMALSLNEVQTVYISCLQSESKLVRIGNQPTVNITVYRRGPSPGSYLGGLASGPGGNHQHRYLFIANPGVNKLARLRIRNRGRSVHSVHLGNPNKPLYVAIAPASPGFDTGLVYVTSPSGGTVSVIDNVDIED